MNVTTEYVGRVLELSKPVGRMSWYKAMSTSWPNGWRMPTRAELVHLYDEASYFDYEFSDTSGVWSSLSYSPIPADAWGVNFLNGYSYVGVKTFDAEVRLVREVIND